MNSFRKAFHLCGWTLQGASCLTPIYFIRNAGMGHWENLMLSGWPVFVVVSVVMDQRNNESIKTGMQHMI